MTVLAHRAHAGKTRRDLTPSWPALLLGLAVSVSACGGSPTDPGSGPVTESSPVALDRSEVTLTRLGETATITARAGSETTTTPALTLVSESRYLGELPVLDPAALAAGQIRASAPGTATLRVAAFDRGPALLQVYVRPARPLVVAATPGAATAEGDTLSVRGFRMQDVPVDGVRVGGIAATVLSRDSATLRIRVPSLSAESCVSGARRDTLWATGADVAPGLTVARKRSGDLELGVGQVVRLTSDQVRCLHFAAVPGARYALAFLDGRKVEEARSGYEGAAPTPSSYSVTVAEVGNGSPTASLAPSLPSFSLATDAVRRSVSSSAAAPTSRATPWREGDRFAVSDPALPAGASARVVRVYGGHLVLALVDGQEPVGGIDAWVARADSAFAQVVERGYPLYRSALSGTLPVTSPGSGQLLVLAYAGGSTALGTSAVVAENGRRLSYVFLNTALPTTGGGLLRTLAHEVAHAWQEQYLQESRPAGATDSGAPATWAVEGNADLLAWTIVGRSYGLETMGNRSWTEDLADPRLVSFALLAANTRGDFTRGYDSGASFQLDLVARLVRHGAMQDEALAQVTRGALEGWYGYDSYGAKREGLTGRMRRSMDAGWDPGEALLRWTLSQATDDLTSNPELQNYAFRAVSTAGKQSINGWLAPVMLHSGGRATREDASSPTTLSGNGAAITWRYGSPNYFLIDDNGFGGAYRLSATAGGATLNGVQWMVVRYQ
ncbi:MAG: hypothetical protein JO040_11975 [Gemmatimonadetes bacterium]|nr:hypothetical protein [Gemmatimonadota bacterium]